MESLDEFCNYLQIKLEKDFCFDDDTVISTMERSMEELKRAKLDYPGVPLPHELPRFPFGTFKEPSFTNKVLLKKSALQIAKYQNISDNTCNRCDNKQYMLRNENGEKTVKT